MLGPSWLDRMRKRPREIDPATAAHERNAQYVRAVDPRFFDLQVDRTFLIEVFFITCSRSFLRAVHHEQLRPKFISNTRLKKGALCLEKSIRSIKNDMVR